MDYCSIRWITQGNIRQVHTVSQQLLLYISRWTCGDTIEEKFKVLVKRVLVKTGAHFLSVLESIPPLPESLWALTVPWVEITPWTGHQSMREHIHTLTESPTGLNIHVFGKTNTGRTCKLYTEKPFGSQLLQKPQRMNLECDRDCTVLRVECWELKPDTDKELQK